MTTVLLIHAASTLAMTGVIWFVQLVHYPLFRFASASTFVEFAAAHQSRTAWVVLPLMSVELASATYLLVRGPEALAGLAAWGAVLLAAIWLSTALIQVPLHRRLSAGLDARAAARLVATNWLRTVAWSARAFIALAMLA